MSIFEQIFNNKEIKRIRIPIWINHDTSGIPDKDLKILKEKFVSIKDRNISNLYLNFPNMDSWCISNSYLSNGNPEEILMCGEKSCNRILCPTIDWFSPVRKS